MRLLLLITGNLRIFNSSMCRIALARSSSSRQQWICAVITSRAVAPRASKLSCANPLHTMSRSVTIPTNRSFSPIGIAPTSWSRINFASSALKSLYGTMRPLRTHKKPFDQKVKDEKATTWLIPKLVGEVKFTEWTREGEMRHPAFLGLRNDKKVFEVIREQP